MRNILANVKRWVINSEVNLSYLFSYNHVIEADVAIDF